MNILRAIAAAFCLCAGVETEMLPQLPALKALSRLSEIRPTIICDSREQDRLFFQRLPSEVAALQSGDYSVRGLEHLFAIERKSCADLVACCGVERDRFFRECHRLRGFWFARLLVVGTRAELENGEYRSRITPKAVMATLATIEVRFSLPVIFIPTPAEAAAEVERWAYYASREVVEMANELCRQNGLTERKPQEQTA
jgi:ERCC4-type nuclease